MVFRFACALVLVLLIAMAGVALEKHNLALRRSLARQQYRLNVLEDRRARLRLQTHELGAPVRTREKLAADSAENEPRQPPSRR